MATMRSNRVSRARYTSPMPPAPSGDWISYGPSFVPAIRAIRARHYIPKEERCCGWDDFLADCRPRSNSVRSCLPAIGFHATFDFANLFVGSGQNAGEYAVGHLLETRWQGPQWLTGGMLGPEASWMVFVVIGLMFV